MPAACGARADLEKGGLSAAYGEDGMSGSNTVLLFVDDAAVLSSLEFALSLEGFAVADGLAAANPSGAVLVIDQACRGDGLALLASLREAGCDTPAVLLATNPSRKLWHQAASVGVILIEKPLLSDELTRTLHRVLRVGETM
jgi:DNA-binding NtrC family response regulator